MKMICPRHGRERKTLTMANQDFDISSLAAYLHLMPAQIKKLVEQGKLPGRRVAGEWKFSGPEVHHWLEERIGVSNHGELVKVEEALEKSDTPEMPTDLRVADILVLETIAIPLQAKTRGKVILRMVELGAETGMLWDTKKMAEAVESREMMQSTALDNGVALMHPRRPMSNILGQPILAMGLTFNGIPFGGAARRLTDIFFLICSTSDHEHLRILARLARIINDQNFLVNLRTCETPLAALDLISAREDEICEML